jgi:hypothetical protein
MQFAADYRETLEVLFASVDLDVSSLGSMDNV